MEIFCIYNCENVSKCNWAYMCLIQYIHIYSLFVVNSLLLRNLLLTIAAGYNYCILDAQKETVLNQKWTRSEIEMNYKWIRNNLEEN